MKNAKQIAVFFFIVHNTIPSETVLRDSRLFGSTGYCSACNKVIPAFEMVMRARNNVYHLECFACQQCNHRYALDPLPFTPSSWPCLHRLRPDIFTSLTAVREVHFQEKWYSVPQCADIAGIILLYNCPKMNNSPLWYVHCYPHCHLIKRCDALLKDIQVTDKCTIGLY